MGIYTGSDLSIVPSDAGVYALVSRVDRAARPKDVVVYIGHTGTSMGLKGRIKTHLVELTGTWTNGKHPVVIDIDQIDLIYVWTVESLLSTVPITDEKIVAEAVELVAKNHFGTGKTMISDSKPPTNQAMQLSQDLQFLSDARDLLENQRSEVRLPSRANLVNRILELEERFESLVSILTGKGILP